MPEPIVIPMTNPIEVQKPRRRLSRSRAGANVSTMAGTRVRETGTRNAAVLGSRRRASGSSGLLAYEWSFGSTLAGATNGGDMAVLATNFEGRVNVGPVERWLSMVAG